MRTVRGARGETSAARVKGFRCAAIAAFLSIAATIGFAGSPAHAGFLDDLKKVGSEFEKIGKGIKDGVEDIVNDEPPAPRAPTEPAPTQTTPPSASQGAGPAPSLAPAYNHHKQRVTRAQFLLNRLGYDAGTVDGLFGGKTRSAILAYETDRNLTPRGDVTDPLLARLAQEAPPENPVAAQPQGAPIGTGAAPPASGATGSPGSGSLVAGPLPGAAPQSGGDGGGFAAPAQGSTPVSGAHNYAALAQAHGVHIARGLPVVAGTRHSVLTNEQLAAASHFLDFVELGLDPDYIERQSLCWASEHLPRHESDRYLVSGGAALDAPNYVTTGSGLIAWKGTDEFEAERAKQAFLSDYSEALKAKAVKLPLEVLAIDEMALPNYDSAAGGFNLRLQDLNSHPITFDALASYRGLGRPRPVCLNADFSFSPPAARLPDIWKIDAARAEQVINRLNQRKIYIAFVLRFREMPLATKLKQYEPTSRIPVWSELVSVALYEDADLERPIATLPVTSAKAPVLLSGVPETLPASAETASVGEKALALLLLRDHGDVLGEDAWHRLMVDQAQHDALYYDRRRDPVTAERLYQNQTDVYDETYVPFFPNRFEAGFHSEFPEGQVTRFKEWALLRAKNLPQQFIIEGKLERIHKQPARFVLSVVNGDRPPEHVQVLLREGYSADQMLRPGTDASAVGRSFNDRSLAGADRSRKAVLILPNIAASYAPDLSDAELQKIIQGASGSGRVEILVRTGPSSLLPIDGESEVFALQVVPTRLRIWDSANRAVVVERDYEVQRLDPNRLDVETLPVSPPAVDALPLTAEAADLLVVKHLPQAVSGEDYRQMMMARWEYEASVPPKSGEPDWGRFFIPGKPKPTPEQQPALLGRFKDWTLKRASALPEKFKLHYRLTRVGDGKPISAEAPWTPSRGNPNSDAGIVNSCRSQIHSAPALAPACDYLESVRANAPSIHPFGRGYVLGGPRLSCATVLPDHRDPYCKAREAQYERPKPHKVEPGFRDVFILDKEIYFPGTPAELETASRGTVNMVLEIAIPDLRMEGEPLPEPFVEARRRYAAFSEALGLRNPGSVREEQIAPATYFVFDASLLSARLVANKTHESIADLELRPARTLDLEALKLPDASTGLPQEPFGPDIVGLRLGMSFEEADKVIRSHMKVARVLVRDRARDPRAVTGEFNQYSSSRIYVAEENREFIVLYDEPPSAPEIVLGITRQLNFPPGQVTAATVLAQLREKYGQEDSKSKHGTLGWGEGLRETNYNDSIAHQCLPAIGNTSADNWLSEDGSPAGWRPAFPPGVPTMTMYNDVRGRICGPVLTAQFEAVNHPKAQDRLVLQATEPNLYRKHYEESKRLIGSGEATPGAEAGAPNLKL